jgi:RNA polymerase sigma-70 factor (ECF subfamily)
MRRAQARTTLKDAESFAAAFGRHAPAALATATAILHDRHAAEDIVQDVFFMLWRKPDAYAPDRGSLGTYVRLLARSRALDALRASAAQSRATDALRAQPVAAEDTAVVAERRVLARELTGAIGRLPRDQRDAVILHHVRGLSDRAVADATAVPLGTAKSRIRLGCRRVESSALRDAA